MEQRLKEIIDKAGRNGFDAKRFKSVYDSSYSDISYFKNDIYHNGEYPSDADWFHVNEVFFSHEFLKAYFGEEVSESRFDKGFGYPTNSIPESQKEKLWQHHAQQLAISEDRIEYLYQFIN